MDPPRRLLLITLRQWVVLVGIGHNRVRGWPKAVLAIDRFDGWARAPGVGDIDWQRS